MDETVYISNSQLEELLGKAYEQGRNGYLETKEVVADCILEAFIEGESIPMADLDDLIIESDPLPQDTGNGGLGRFYISTTTSGTTAYPYYTTSSGTLLLDNQVSDVSSI
jgi:hypothetical protein